MYRSTVLLSRFNNLFLLISNNMKNLNIVDWVFLVLLVIGGLNWGLVGFLNFDLVSSIFGVMTTMTRGVYAIVGISALYSIYTLSAKTS